MSALLEAQNPMIEDADTRPVEPARCLTGVDTARGFELP
jgi:hypothetical protein